MKTKLLLTALFLSSLFFITSCKKDKEEKSEFDYPMEDLYGHWDGSESYIAGKWVDITKEPYNRYAYSVKFNSDKTFSTTGYVGTVVGTYTAIKKTIVVYTEKGTEFARLDIKSLTEGKVEMTMKMYSDSTDSRDVRMKKR